MKVAPLATCNQSFGKIELGRVSVRKKDGGMEDVKLVEYEPDNLDDMQQIYDLKVNWLNDARAYFICHIADNFENLQLYGNLPDKDEIIYGLEDCTGDTLVLADVLNHNRKSDGGIKKSATISFIEARPDLQSVYGVSEGEFRGLGETLVSEIVKIAKKKGSRFVDLESCNEGFWTKSGMFEYKYPVSRNHESPDRMLPSSKYDDYIKYVEDKRAAHGAKARKGLDISL